MVFVKNCNTDHAFTYIINLFCLDSDKLNLNQYRKNSIHLRNQYILLDFREVIMFRNAKARDLSC